MLLAYACFYNSARRVRGYDPVVIGNHPRRGYSGIRMRMGVLDDAVVSHKSATNPSIQLSTVTSNAIIE